MCTLLWPNVCLRNTITRWSCDSIACVCRAGHTDFPSWGVSTLRVFSRDYGGRNTNARATCVDTDLCLPCERGVSWDRRWTAACFECSSQIKPSFSEDDTGTDLSSWLDLKPEREMPLIHPLPSLPFSSAFVLCEGVFTVTWSDGVRHYEPLKRGACTNQDGKYEKSLPFFSFSFLRPWAYEAFGDWAHQHGQSSHVSGWPFDVSCWATTTQLSKLWSLLGCY